MVSLVVVVSASPIARAATSSVSVPLEARWGLVGVTIRVARPSTARVKASTASPLTVAASLLASSRRRAATHRLALSGTDVRAVLCKYESLWGLGLIPQREKIYQQKHR